MPEKHVNRIIFLLNTKKNGNQYVTLDCF